MAYPKWYTDDKDEVLAAKKRLEESKLPLLLSYIIQPLQYSGDGRPMYYHKRIYYWPDINKVKEDVQFSHSDRATQTTLPGTVDLTLAFAEYDFDKKPIETAQLIGVKVSEVIESIMRETDVGSYEQLGKLLAHYFLEAK